VVVKTVTLTKDAYDSLAALKNEGESFSEVIRRLTRSQALLSSFAGAWIGAPKRDVEQIRKSLRDADRRSRAKLRRLTRRAADRGEPG
jgi:predicted CopG family antitoxin